MALPLTGCSSPPHRDEPPLPSGEHSALLLADGTTLPLSRWPTPSPARAVVLALHGLNGHRGNFTALGEYLQGNGIALYAYDQRGFGATASRGHWPGADALIDDLRQVVRELSASHPGTPLFLLGESMGAAVILQALEQDNRLPVSGMVLVAPAVMEREAVSPLLRMVVWLGARMVPWLTIDQENSAVPLAKRPELLAQLREDPQMLQTTRLDTLEAVYQLMYRAMEEAASVHVPARLIYGGRDNVVQVEMVERLHQRLATATASFYPEGFHLLLHDKEEQMVQQDILGWISEQEAAMRPRGNADLEAAATHSGWSRSTSR